MLISSLIVSLSLLTLRSCASSVPLPISSGPCNVHIRPAELTDQSRIDPFDPRHQKRSIMISTFSLVHCGTVQSAAYLPKATAMFEDESFQSLGLPNGTFESLTIPANSFRARADTVNPREYPLILFSPALATSRLIYTLLLQDIASYGFAVVSIDHPYDADVVEFPDGRVVLGTLSNISTEAEIDPALDVRVSDVSFVLSQLRQTQAIQKLFPALRETGRGLRLNQVAAFGHSLGGATAAQAMLMDDRFAGGINLDGALWGTVVHQGLFRPFLLFGHTNHTQATEPRATFWSHLRGWRLELELANSQHYTFSDFLILVDSLRLSDMV